MSYLVPRCAGARTRRRPRNLVAALALLGAALSASTGLAAAADAPVRTIARDAAGLATPSMQPVAVSNDGKEVLANLDSKVVVRDVVAGTTKVIVSTPDSYVAALQATPDLRFVLLETSSNLIPSDTDGGRDLFVLDRSTGKITKATDVPLTMSDGAAARFFDWYDLQLSGDGRYLTYRMRLLRYDDTTGDPIVDNQLWQYDRLSDRATKLRTLPDAHWNLEVHHRASGGQVLVSGTTAIVGGTRLVPLPLEPAVEDSYATAAVSSDGSAIAVATGLHDDTIDLVSTATGAVTKVPVAAGLASNGYELLNVSNGGGVMLLRDRITTNSGARQRLGFLSKAGALTQIGRDVPATSGSPALVPSETLGFAANNAFLAQLGSAPLPGTEPVAASQALSLYMSYTDTWCKNGPYGVTNYRATVTLASTPKGIDPRTPASASVKVYKLGAPSTLYNVFTMNAGATRELTVPQTGGWTYAATITFTDGSKMNGSVDIPVHPKYVCDPFYWF